MSISIGQWFSLAAIILMAPHLSFSRARWIAGLCILWSVFGPFILEWMSK